MFYKPRRLLFYGDAEVYYELSCVAAVFLFFGGGGGEQVGTGRHIGRASERKTREILLIPQKTAATQANYEPI